MALQRREALALAAVAFAAAAAGLAVGRGFLRGTPDGIDALAGARFRDLSGEQRVLAEWRGKVLVLNFWATWCAPCREEIPMLMVSREKHLGSGFEIVGIAIDNDAKVSEYVANMRIRYPILLAEREGLNLMRRLGNSAGGLPFTVLLDRKGNPLWHKLGALRQEELESMLGEVLVKDLPARG